MKVTMRLYKRHDLDLLYLYNSPNFSFQKSLKKIICDYVRSGGVISSEKRVVLPVDYVGFMPRLTQLHIYLSETDDADVIKWIKQLTNGYKNSLLKNIYRNYLSAPVIIPYYKDNEKFNIASTGLADRVNSKVKPVIDEVLNTSLPEQKTNIVLERGNMVLKEPIMEKSNKDANMYLEERKTKEETVTDEFDIIDEFENMIQNF